MDETYLAHDLTMIDGDARYLSCSLFSRLQTEPSRKPMAKYLYFSILLG